MNLTKLFSIRALLAIVLLFSAAASKAQIYYYQLEPGSTITRYNGGTPIAAPEALTGTFRWEFRSITSGGTQYNYETLGLSLQSATISLVTDSTPLFLRYNAAWTSQEILFNASVLATGLPGNELDFTTYPNYGTFNGTAANPTRLIFSNNLYLANQGGGLYQARLSFTAIQVPEPGSLTLLGVGSLALLRKRRSKAG